MSLNAGDRGSGDGKDAPKETPPSGSAGIGTESVPKPEDSGKLAEMKKPSPGAQDYLGAVPMSISDTKPPQPGPPPGGHDGPAGGGSNLGPKRFEDMNPDEIEAQRQKRFEQGQPPPPGQPMETSVPAPSGEPIKVAGGGGDNTYRDVPFDQASPQQIYDQNQKRFAQDQPPPPGQEVVSSAPSGGGTAGPDQYQVVMQRMAALRQRLNTPVA